MNITEIVKPENNIYKTVRADAEFLVTVPGLFYDKDKKLLIITEQFDGSDCFIEPSAWNDSRLVIFGEDGFSEYLYYKDGNETYELWLDNIDDIECKNDGFRLIDGIWFQFRWVSCAYALKYTGVKGRKEITIDSRKIREKYIEIGCCCFSGTDIEKINIIDTAEYQTGFRKYCFNNMDGLKHINIFSGYKGPLNPDRYAYMTGSKNKAVVTIITDMDSMKYRIKEAEKITEAGNILVGVLANENGKIKDLE